MGEKEVNTILSKTVTSGTVFLIPLKSPALCNGESLLQIQVSWPSGLVCLGIFNEMVIDLPGIHLLQQISLAGSIVLAPL